MEKRIEWPKERYVSDKPPIVLSIQFFLHGVPTPAYCTSPLTKYFTKHCTRYYNPSVVFCALYSLLYCDK